MASASPWKWGIDDTKEDFFDKFHHGLIVSDAAFTGSTGDHGTDLFTDLAGRVCRIWHTKWERVGTAGIFLHSLICVREPGMLYL